MSVEDYLDDAFDDYLEEDHWEDDREWLEADNDLDDLED